MRRRISQARANLALGLILTGVALASCGGAVAAQHVLVVQGLGGGEVWEARFQTQSAGLLESFERSGAQVSLLAGAAATRDQLAAQLAALAGRVNRNDTLLAVFVGHGSYDGQEYKFNMPGPDVTGTELLDWLSAVPSARTALINTSSASGALQALRPEGDRLLLVTATRNGRERQATRFAGYLLAALSDPSADLDKNRSITLAEAFAFAERGVADAFDGDNRLATEHPVLAGQGANRFTLARLGNAARAPKANTRHAELVAERSRLDEQITALRLRKDTMDAQAYLGELQQLLIDLALINDQIEAQP